MDCFSLSVSFWKFPVLRVSWGQDAVSPPNDFLSLGDYRITSFPVAPPLFRSPQTLRERSKEIKPSPLDVPPKNRSTKGRRGMRVIVSRCQCVSVLRIQVSV